MRIIDGLVVGTDGFGDPLICGEVCNVTLESGHEEFEDFTGIIVYNEFKYRMEVVSLEERSLPLCEDRVIGLEAVASPIAMTTNRDDWINLYNKLITMGGRNRYRLRQ